MTQTQCIAASNPTAAACILIRWYAKHREIEPQFYDTEDINFGMSLSRK